MSEILNTLTSALVSKMLDISSLQHGVIATNVANINSSHYRPLKLNFETELTRIKDAFEGPSLEILRGRSSRWTTRMRKFF